MVKPIFARPGSTIALPDQSAFIALLNRYDVPYQRWENGEQELERLWLEVENRDVVYTTTHQCFGPEGRDMPLRFLVTTTAWVGIRLPPMQTFVLIEQVYNPKTNSYERRRHQGSVSEKRKLRWNGVPAESDLQTLIRCLAEEARIMVEEVEVKGNFHFKPWTEGPVRMSAAQHVEQDYKVKEGMPGLAHFNQVAHYYAYLPEHTKFLGWRLDPQTRYLTWWGSAQESSTQLDPIPASLVHI